MVLKKRAINQAQKNQRRQKILDCGLALFAKSDYDKVSMARIAKCAGMAKGTVFLYFPTKEELFLVLTEQAFTLLFDDLDSMLGQKHSSKHSLDRLMFSLTTVLQKHDQLVRLVTFSHIILEHNVRYSSALRYKKMLSQRMLQTGNHLETTIPFLVPGQGGKLLQWMYALIIGFGHMAQPAPIMKQIFKKEPSLRIHAIDFNTYFFDALQTLLLGWQAASKKPRR